MHLKLTPKAYKFITENGNSATIGLDKQICYSWGGAQSRDIPSVRWGQPESSEQENYDMQTVDGTTVYVHKAIKGIANARIDLVSGGVGTKLIFLGFAGAK